MLQKISGVFQIGRQTRNPGQAVLCHKAAAIDCKRQNTGIRDMRKRADENIYNIGSNIRTARRRADLTQEQLSESIGVTPQYLSDLERGLVGTSIPTLIKICTKLNVSADFILFGRTGENGITDTTLIERVQRLPKHEANIVKSTVKALLDSLETEAD